jgi:hypothetical protein
MNVKHTVTHIHLHNVLQRDDNTINIMECTGKEPLWIAMSVSAGYSYHMILEFKKLIRLILMWEKWEVGKD